MRKSLILGMTVGSMIMFSGCATIVSGDTQQILVNSNPSNLKVELDNQTSTTPTVFLVKRENKDKIIKVEDNQCKQVKTLKKKINPWFFGNIVFGGLVGSTTDSVTGAMWKYDDNVNINCQK